MKSSTPAASLLLDWFAELLACAMELTGGTRPLALPLGRFVPGETDELDPGLLANSGARPSILTFFCPSGVKLRGVFISKFAG